MAGAMDDSGRRYWRCTSFHGKKGTPIKGRRFTQKGQPLRQNIDETKSHVRYRRAHRKLPEPRQMLCTDIEIGADKPEKPAGKGTK